MSKGTVNKVIIIGRLGADPEIRYMPNGNAVGNLRIATNDGYKDKDGQYVEQTEWHSVAVFGRNAENAEKYLKKGSLVYIEGRLSTEKWQDKGGKDRSKTGIKAQEMQLMGDKPEQSELEVGEKPRPEKLVKNKPIDNSKFETFEDQDIPF
jgi:single-strand DNA-binding protein